MIGHRIVTSHQIEADQFTYEPKPGRGDYQALHVRAGNRGVQHIVPPAGEDHAYDRQEWARTDPAELAEKLRGMSRAYPEDIFPTPPARDRCTDAGAAHVMRRLAVPWLAAAADTIDQLSGELEWVRGMLIAANADTIEALRVRLRADSPA